MTRRRIRTLWITRKSDEFPELIEAWGEYSLEANYRGWEEAVRVALAAVGSDLHAWRFIDLTLDGDALQSAFDEPILDTDLFDPQEGGQS